jgi:hypothetical protein
MLIDILRMVKEETGIKYDTNANEKNLAIARINRSAEELHRMMDLHTSIVEEVVDINMGTQQVTFPPYVGIIRGCRYFDNRLKVPIDAMNNRYQSGFGNETWYLKFREKEDTVLLKEIQNQSTLLFTISIAESTDIKITISGPTSNSATFKETVIITAGTLSATSVGNYKSPLRSLDKNRKTLYDITITDVDNNILAIFPNNLYALRHKCVQTGDWPFLPTPNSLAALEIQYKKRYIPLVEDDDQFVCGEIYDTSIFYKYMEHRSRTLENAQAWMAKCNQAIAQIWDDLKAGKRELIDFVPRGFFDMPYGPSGQYKAMS